MVKEINCLTAAVPVRVVLHDLMEPDVYSGAEKCKGKLCHQPSARSAETATSSSAVPVAANESATSYSIRCPDGTLTSVEDIQQHEVLTCCDGVPVQVIRAVRHEREEHQEAD